MKLLKLSKVSKSFSGEALFEKLNLDVKKGEIIGITGGNGSGKTTLAEIIAGFQEPDQGKIIFKGNNLTDMTPSQISEKGVKIGFQDKDNIKGVKPVKLLQCSRENTSFFRSILNIRKTKKFSYYESDLNFFQLGSKSDDYIGNLSGGQQSIIESLKTTVSDFELIILDEPFNGLSQQNKNRLETYLSDKVSSSTGIILIDHDVNRLHSLSDRLFKLEENRLNEVNL